MQVVLSVLVERPSSSSSAQQPDPAPSSFPCEDTPSGTDNGHTIDASPRSISSPVPPLPAASHDDQKARGHDADATSLVEGLSSSRSTSAQQPSLGPARLVTPLFGTDPFTGTETGDTKGGPLHSLSSPLPPPYASSTGHEEARGHAPPPSVSDLRPPPCAASTEHEESHGHNADGAYVSAADDVEEQESAHKMLACGPQASPQSQASDRSVVPPLSTERKISRPTSSELTGLKRLEFHQTAACQALMSLRSTLRPAMLVK
mmetsp:Transcript_28126/g.80998  ORF Transcript_28126/g.80998 Transcript_28126/m.80998 type:complete len:261 (-) Transcript_28126:1387-2169(-)